MSHYKSLFDYKHLGCQDLPRDAKNKPMDIIVTMTKLEKREVVTEGGKKDILPVADLKGAPKPMIMNKTNLKTLSELFETTEYEDFVGRTFSIGKSMVKGKAGSLVEGLRVRPIKVEKVKAEMNPLHPKWNGAVKALKENNTTIEDIERNYSLSPENKSLILSLS